MDFLLWSIVGYVAGYLVGMWLFPKLFDWMDRRR